ncbi:hypothetical protein MHU86_7344 [Fragilaria crotonensis]|nr:hypothetical protein MHU86_7344 [Fragilaria crotonensis]
MFRSPLITSLVLATVVTEHHAAMVDPSERTLKPMDRSLRAAVVTIYGPSNFSAVGREPEFGTTVRSNGNIWAAAAPHYGDADQGGAFVYDSNNDVQWSLVGNPLEAIGGRLSLSESCVAIGRKSTIEVYSVYTGAMKGSPVKALSGNDVSLVNDTLLMIGEDRYNNRQGQVRIMNYNESSNSWNPIQTLSGLQQTESRFGWVVVASDDGGRIAVSAPNASPNISRQGYVQVLERDDRGLWLPLGSILYGAVEEGQFGFSLAISGDGSTVVVGSPGTNEGGVRLYRISNGDWALIGSALIAKESGIRFGRAVAVSYEGDRVAATSFFHDSTRGHVRVFDLIDETWIEQYDIEGSMVGDWLGWGNFGLNLSPNGSTLKVGSVLADNLEGDSTGSVNIFDLKTMNSKPTTAPSIVPSTSPSQLLVLLEGPVTATTSPITIKPSSFPTAVPTVSVLVPSSQPYSHVTSPPSPVHTPTPTARPTSSFPHLVTSNPEASPSTEVPTSKPSPRPTLTPVVTPSLLPNTTPLSLPTILPRDPTTPSPTDQSRKPSHRPTGPTSQQSSKPTIRPTAKPTLSLSDPSGTPLVTPTSLQSSKPSTNQPTIQLSSKPTLRPSPPPSENVTPRPTGLPTLVPSTRPFSSPSDEPSELETFVSTQLPTSSPPTTSKEVPDNLSPGSAASTTGFVFALSLVLLSLFY